MVLYVVKCGCKFEPCHAVELQEGRLQALCRCAFIPYGPTVIASDQAELDNRNDIMNQKIPMPWEVDDARPPDMPQGEPREPPYEPQNGPGEERSRQDRTSEIEKDSGEQGAGKRKFAPRPSPESGPAFSHHRQTRKGANTGLRSSKRKAPRQGRGLYTYWEDATDEDESQPEAKSPAMDGGFWSPRERAPPAAGLRDWARQPHERSSPQGWSAYRGPTEGEHRSTATNTEASGAIPFMSHHRARTGIRQAQQPMRAHRQRRSSAHHQQHGHEHRQRNEATQQPASQGQRTGNEAAKNDADAAFRVAEQDYLSVCRNEPMSKTERDHKLQRYRKMKASRLNGDGGAPARGSWIPGDDLFNSTSGTRTRQHAPVEGALGRNKRDSRRAHPNYDFPVPDEAEGSANDAGAHKTGRRRNGRHGQHGRPRSPR